MSVRNRLKKQRQEKRLQDEKARRNAEIFAPYLKDQFIPWLVKIKQEHPEWEMGDPLPDGFPPCPSPPERIP